MNWHVKRLGQALFTLWAVANVSFILIWSLPGDAVARYVQGFPEHMDTEEIEAALEERLMIHPDASLGEAYVQYMSRLLTGDLGESFFIWGGETPVEAIIADGLPYTLFVMGLATLGTFGVSLALGAVQAYKEQSLFDYSNTAVGILTTSVPYYVAALLLIKYVGHSDWLFFDWFPTQNRKPGGVETGLNWDFISGVLRHAALPAFSYILTAYGALALAMRGNSIQVLGEDYVRVAELRGLPSRRISLRYVGRNAVLPLYTSLMIALGAMLGAGIVLEEIFTYKGIGYWMLDAVEKDDVPVMMGTFLTVTVGLVIGLYVADLTYGKLDPRIKSGDEGEAY